MSAAHPIYSAFWWQFLRWLAAHSFTYPRSCCSYDEHQCSWVQFQYVQYLPAEDCADTVYRAPACCDDAEHDALVPVGWHTEWSVEAMSKKRYTCLCYEVYLANTFFKSCIFTFWASHWQHYQQCTHICPQYMFYCLSDLFSCLLDYFYSLPTNLAMAPSSCRGCNLTTLAADGSSPLAAATHSASEQSLKKPASVPACVFWHLYKFCKGCNSIVGIYFYQSQEHICDLTDLS